MVIDLTGLGSKQTEEEPEDIYCKLCPFVVKMLYCNQDNSDKQQGPLYKKGDYVCPRCGNVKAGLNKKKEQKAQS